MFTIVLLVGICGAAAWSLWDSAPVASVIFALPIIVAPLVSFFLIRSGATDGGGGSRNRTSVHVHLHSGGGDGGADFDDGDD